jgi:chromosome segregation ATPase
LAALPRLEAQSAAVPSSARPSAGATPPAPAQPGASAPSQQQPVAAGTGDDRFASMRVLKDQLREKFEQTSDANSKSIEEYLKKKTCNINHVDDLLTDTQEAMKVWYEAEMKFWTETELVENERVEGQRKSLASMEEDVKTTQSIVDSLTEEHNRLLRDKATLEKEPKRTVELQKQLDQIILDIREEEGRLSEAQQSFEDANAKVTNTKIALDARLIEVRQYQVQVKTYVEQMKAYYQTLRASADSICSLPGAKGPKALPTAKGRAQ